MGDGAGDTAAGGTEVRSDAGEGAEVPDGSAGDGCTAGAEGPGCAA